MALIIGTSFLYYGTKFDSTSIFLTILKIMLCVSDWQKYQYQLMGHFSKRIPQVFKFTSFGVLAYVSTVYGIQHALLR